MRRALLVFLDGVGIGPGDPERNPFFRASLPVLRDLLKGELPSLEALKTAALPDRLLPLDANLEVEGIPQSGTGQTTLLTGTNAARLFGRHFGPWTPVRLRPLLAERNLLSRTLEAGRPAAFANAYPEGWPGSRAARFPAAPPLAARAAGLLVRHADALARGDAVASGISNRGWREGLGHEDVPDVTPEEAGRNLAGIAREHALTLYAHYATDYAGHQEMEEAVEALERVDAFLGGLVDALPRDALLVVASDHGNVEDATTGHTRNPVLGLMVGPVPSGRPTSIADVAPWMLEWLEG